MCVNAIIRVKRLKNSCKDLSRTILFSNISSTRLRENNNKKKTTREYNFRSLGISIMVRIPSEGEKPRDFFFFLNKMPILNGRSQRKSPRRRRNCLLYVVVCHDYSR